VDDEKEKMLKRAPFATTHPVCRYSRSDLISESLHLMLCSCNNKNNTTTTTTTTPVV
jgi:hypothetical protein